MNYRIRIGDFSLHIELECSAAEMNRVRMLFLVPFVLSRTSTITAAWFLQLRGGFFGEISSDVLFRVGDQFFESECALPSQQSSIAIAKDQVVSHGPVPLEMPVKTRTAAWLQHS